MLEAKLNIRLVVGNDAKVAALAEGVLGAGQGAHVMQYITISTGILDFPSGSVVKNPPANTGDVGSIPGSGRSPKRRKW